MYIVAGVHFYSRPAAPAAVADFSAGRRRRPAAAGDFDKYVYSLHHRLVKKCVFKF
jgi:hypothetical protein